MHSRQSLTGLTKDVAPAFTEKVAVGLGEQKKHGRGALGLETPTKRDGRGVIVLALLPLGTQHGALAERNDDMVKDLVDAEVSFKHSGRLAEAGKYVRTSTLCRRAAMRAQRPKPVKVDSITALPMEEAEEWMSISQGG